MKQAKTLIILVIILALAVGGYFIASAIAKSMENTDTVEEETTYSVYTAETDEITALSYVKDGETLAFTKNSDTWTWDKNNNVPISTDSIETMLAYVENMTSSRIIDDTDDTKLESFGLAEPSNTVSVTKDGETTEFVFGTKNTALDAYYAYKNGDKNTVYLIDSDTAEAFSEALTDLIENDTLTKIESGNALTIQIKNGDSTRVFKYFADGDKTDYTKIFNWYMSDNGGEYFPLEETAATNLTTELAGMALASFKSYEQEYKTENGLDTPVTVTFTYLDSDGNEQSQILNLGNSIDTNSRYACKGNSCLTYSYSGTAVLDLIDKTCEELLTDRVFRPTWSYITQISVTDGAKTADIGIETVEVEAETEESTEEDTEETTEETTAETTTETVNKYTLNGEESDYETVIPLFNSLSGLKASKNTVTDGITATKDSKTVMTFVFKLNGEETPDSFTLEIQEYTDEYYRISADGRSTLLITAAEYDELANLFSGIAK